MLAEAAEFQTRRATGAPGQMLIRLTFLASLKNCSLQDPTVSLTSRIIATVDIY